MVVKINPITSESIETNICQPGTLPDGMRAIITIGEENGMILPQTAIGESGLPTAVAIITNERMMGIVMGNISDCASCGSSFTTLPTAANSEA